MTAAHYHSAPSVRDLRPLETWETPHPVEAKAHFAGELPVIPNASVIAIVRWKRSLQQNTFNRLITCTKTRNRTMSKQSISLMIAASALMVIAIAEVSRTSHATPVLAKATSTGSSCFSPTYEISTGQSVPAQIQCYTTWSDGSRCITAQTVALSTNGYPPDIITTLPPVLACAFTGTGVP